MPVDADGDLDKLAAVLVPHVDAVLPGVFRGDFVDDNAGELAAVERDLGVFAGGDFLLVLEPGDLRGRLAPHGAGQAQGLEKMENQLKSNSTHDAPLQTTKPLLIKTDCCSISDLLGQNATD